MPVMRSFEAFAPGRTEIAGNHLDHQGGTVLAASIAAGISAVVQIDGSDQIAVDSIGYAPFAVSLSALNDEMNPAWRATPAAIVFGMARELTSQGVEPCGMRITATSDLPAGGGLSSSAAFELLVGRILEAAAGLAPLPPIEMARIAQLVETQYFGKPCGLMDQSVIALGGAQVMSFADASSPVAEPLDFDLAELGWALVLTDTRIRHDGSAAAADFASIPADMSCVARALGARRLGEVDQDAFEAAAERLAAKLGERAVARARHYYLESSYTAARIEALSCGDMEAFCAAMRLSAASSADNLANSGRAAPVLALAQELDGCGASRIHGGGFGGSIQTALPLEDAPRFISDMEERLGPGCCMMLELTQEGAQTR